MKLNVRVGQFYSGQITKKWVSFKPALTFKSMKTAYATIKGFELMRMFKKGQLDIWKLGQGLTGEIWLIERQFGIYRT